MNSRTLDQEWRRFEAALLDPIDAPEIQRREMRRAFYAGALAILQVAYEIGGDDISEEQGVKMMEALYQECQRFSTAIKAGKA